MNAPTIGGYRLLDEVGRGGMGVVYRATGPDGRPVAVKVLLDALWTSETDARFERERRLLSVLGEGDGFVPLIDAGSSDAGAFFVMPFVGGGSLRQRLAARGGRLEVGDVVFLGRALAAALARAHRRGVVHRDLKPDNVLFTEDGRPLVADMGLAKHFDPGRSGAGPSGGLSKTGMFKGTLGYIAPEQMRDAKSAGPPADVYSLGAILYESLAGRAPYWSDSPAELMVIILNAPYESVRAHRKEAPPWLDELVETCLHREVDARPSARDLLARLEEGEAGWRARTRRAARARLFRRLGPVLAGVLAVAGLVALLVARRGGERDDDGARRPTGSIASGSASVGAGTAGATSDDAVPPRPEDGAAPPAPSAPRMPADYRRLLDGDPALRLLEVWGWPVARHGTALSDVAFSPDGSRVASASTDSNVIVWDADTEERLLVLPHGRDIFAWAVAWSADGRRLVTASSDARVRTWDGATGAPLVDASAHDAIGSLAVTRDGRILGGGRTGVIEVWEPDATEASFRLEVEGGRAVTALRLLPSGEVLAAYGDGFVRRWNLETRAMAPFAACALSAPRIDLGDEGRLAIIGGRTEATVVAVADGRVVARLGRDEGVPVQAVALSPDGRRALTAAFDSRDGWVWDVERQARPHRLVGHTDRIVDVAISPDGTRAASGSFDANLLRWDVELGQPLRPPVPGHRASVNAILARAGSREVISLDHAGEVRSWDLGGERPSRLVGRASPDAGRLAVTDDGRRAFVGGLSGAIEEVDLDTGRVSPFATLATANRAPTSVGALAVSPDQGSLVAGSFSGELFLFSIADRSLRSSVRMTTAGAPRPVGEGMGEFSITHLRGYSADGALALAGTFGGLLQIVDVVGQRAHGDAMGVTADGVSIFALSADRRRVFSATREGQLGVLALSADGRGPPVFARAIPPNADAHRGYIEALALTADERRVVTAGRDGAIRVWNTATGGELASLDVGAVIGVPVLSLALVEGDRELVAGTGRGPILRFAMPDE